MFRIDSRITLLLASTLTAGVMAAPSERPSPVDRRAPVDFIGASIDAFMEVAGPPLEIVTSPAGLEFHYSADDASRVLVVDGVVVSLSSSFAKFGESAQKVPRSGPFLGQPIRAAVDTLRPLGQGSWSLGSTSLTLEYENRLQVAIGSGRVVGIVPLDG